MASQIMGLTIVYSTVYSRSRSKKISKFRVTGLCEGSSPVTGEFPAQRDSNAENISIWWRHHDFKVVIFELMLINISSICCKITVTGVPQDLTDDWSNLVSNLMTPHGVTKPQWFNRIIPGKVSQYHDQLSTAATRLSMKFLRVFCDFKHRKLVLLLYRNPFWLWVDEHFSKCFLWCKKVHTHFTLIALQ